jgi:hypothetical protein
MKRGNIGASEGNSPRESFYRSRDGVLRCALDFVAVFGSLGVSAGAEQACKNVHSLQKLACGGSARTKTAMLSAEQYQYTLRIFSALPVQDTISHYAALRFFCLRRMT